MPIKYSCVHDGTAVVAEHPSAAELPKLAETMQKVLATVPPKEFRRKTLEDKPNSVSYHYLSGGEGRIVACVASSDVKMRTIFAFLEAVEPLVRQVPDIAKTGKKILQQKTDFYNDPKNDKITALNDDINQVVDVMMDNIDKVLARGDKLDSLSAKSTTLAEQSKQFETGATSLKRALCFKNIKLTIAIVIAVTVVLIIILMIACKPNFSSCK